MIIKLVFAATKQHLWKKWSLVGGNWLKLWKYISYSIVIYGWTVFFSGITFHFVEIGEAKPIGRGAGLLQSSIWDPKMNKSTLNYITKPGFRGGALWVGGRFYRFVLIFQESNSKSGNLQSDFFATTPSPKSTCRFHAISHPTWCGCVTTFWTLLSPSGWVHSARVKLGCLAVPGRPYSLHMWHG